MVVIKEAKLINKTQLSKGAKGSDWPGITLFQYTASIGLSTGNVIVADAPTNYKIIGGGAYCIPPDNNVFMGNYPDPVSINPTRWWATVINNATCGTPVCYFSLLCINDPNDYFEVNVAQAVSPTSGFCVSQTATCPTGYVMTGGGAQISVESYVDGAALTASYPMTNFQWTASSVSLSTNPGDSATITVYALSIIDTTQVTTFSNNILFGQNQTTPVQDPMSSIVTTNQMSCGGAQVFFQSGTGNFISGSFATSLYSWKTASHYQVSACDATITSYLVELFTN